MASVARGWPTASAEGQEQQEETDARRRARTTTAAAAVDVREKLQQIGGARTGQVKRRQKAARYVLTKVNLAARYRHCLNNRRQKRHLYCRKSIWGMRPVHCFTRFRVSHNLIRPSIIDSGNVIKSNSSCGGETAQTVTVILSLTIFTLPSNRRPTETVTWTPTAYLERSQSESRQVFLRSKEPRAPRATVHTNWRLKTVKGAAGIEYWAVRG